MLGEIPPERLTAWERATDEERAAAIERERRYEELHATLLADYQAGAIDADTYTKRMKEVVDQLYIARA